VSAFLPLTNLYNSTVSSAAELNQRIISSSSVGEKHACYVAGAKVICSGKDHYGVGALGNGTTSLTSPTGTTTATGGAPKKLCSGKAFTCSLNVSNQVECWGDDSSGQIASGGYALSATAVSLPVGVGSAIDISCMEKSLCVIGENQRIYCQGQDYLAGTFSEVMTSRVGEKFIKLKTGQRFGCAQTEDQKLICFGAVNNTAQQGNLSGVKDEGVIVMSNDNTSLTEKPVQEFTVGANHACASSIETDGSETLFCWGDNSRGQVQQTSTDAVIVASSTSGRPVNGTVYDMAAGSEHTCLHISGNIQCFGRKNVLGIDITNATPSDFNPILPLIYRAND
jgi:alpha-tubulin suppressor-like RCC1 family protein